MKKIFIALGALSIASISFAKEVVAQPVIAQEPEVVIAQPVVVDAGYELGEFQQLKSVPGFSISAPSGLAGSWGTVFTGVSFRANSDDKDAALAFGTGFGNAFESIGGTAVVGIGSVDPRDGGAFNRGSLDLAFGHNFSEYGFGLSAGATNINLWRETSANDNDPSFYLAGTKLLPNDVAPVILTAGLGNNNYVSYKRGGDFKKKVDGFGAVAVYVHPQISLIADYTSGLTAAGVSFVPVKHWPVNLTVGADDIFKQSEQEKVSFIASLSASYTF